MPVIYRPDKIDEILERLGPFTGSDNNNVLGFLRSLARMDDGITTPADMGGQYDHRIHSQEAISVLSRLTEGSIVFEILTMLIGSVDSGRIEDTHAPNGRLLVLQESGNILFCQMDTAIISSVEGAITEIAFVGGNESSGETITLRVFRGGAVDDFEDVLTIDWEGIQQRIVPLPGPPDEYVQPGQRSQIQFLSDGDYSKLQIDAVAFLGATLTGP